MPAIFRPSDFSVYFVVHPFDSPLVYVRHVINFPPHAIF
ncbi:hypothetical protein ACCE111639_02375 [Acinetobacter celticus]